MANYSYYININYLMSTEQYNLKRRLEREESLLGGIRPTSKNYQKQFHLVKDLKLHLEFLELQDKANGNDSEQS